jgi:UDP-N-acetyl-2-amino-2-deoxyglucuronate dehydrogenase
LHDAHCRLALRVGADAICEKPLVINPWNLDALQNIEEETKRRIWTVLQLRLHPKLLALHDSIRKNPHQRYKVDLTYVTARGNWYHHSWKGNLEKSGGVVTNIGIHLFDLLLWLFGPAGESHLYCLDEQKASGYMELDRADVRWYLSVDYRDLPFPVSPGVRSTYRSITIDGEEVEFTEGFTDLHTRVYEETLAGRGFSIADARSSLELTYRIRTSPVEPRTDKAHEFLK